MMHRIFGRKLGRTTDERKRLIANLSRSLFFHGKINTTLAKAKAIQPFVERLITKAKIDNLTTRRLLSKSLVDREIVERVIKVVGPAFKNRPGGYTRIIKTPPSYGDNAKRAVLMFTEKLAEPKKADLPAGKAGKKQKVAGKISNKTLTKEHAKDTGHKTK